MARKLDIQLNRSMRDKPSRIIYWVKTEVGYFKLNTDGSIHRYRYVCGGIIRDYKGFLIQAYSIPLNHCSVLYAELYAILYGLTVASNLGISKLWIEIDALIVINILSKVFSYFPSIYYIVKRIITSLNLFDYKISHIMREGNKYADWLANNGTSLLNLKVYDNNDCPTDLHRIIKMDLLGFPNFREI